MFKRVLFSVIMTSLLLTPVLADSSSLNPAAALQDGPSSSTADSLQPALPQDLQGSDAVSAGIGLPANDSTGLQSPASGSNIQLDGSSTEPTHQLKSATAKDWWEIGAALFFIAVAWVWLMRDAAKQNGSHV